MPTSKRGGIIARILFPKLTNQNPSNDIGYSRGNFLRRSKTKVSGEKVTEKQFIERLSQNNNAIDTSNLRPVKNSTWSKCSAEKKWFDFLSKLGVGSMGNKNIAESSTSSPDNSKATHRKPCRTVPAKVNQHKKVRPVFSSPSMFKRSRLNDSSFNEPNEYEWEFSSFYVDLMVSRKSTSLETLLQKSLQAPPTPDVFFQRHLQYVNSKKKVEKLNSYGEVNWKDGQLDVSKDVDISPSVIRKAILKDNQGYRNRSITIV